MNNNLWYVLKVSSGREEKIKLAIETELRVLGADLDIVDMLVPSEKVYEVKAGKRKIKQKPFFPGYLFVSVVNLSENVRTAFRSVPGVLGFLSGRNWGWSVEPVPMKRDEVIGMLGMEANKGSSQEVVFLVNDFVKIIDGPFKGLTGIVKEVLKEKKRLNVTVTIFDRPAPVELNYMQVDRCK